MIKTLFSKNGAQARITHHGAQVTSWVPAHHAEQLFLSKTSSFEEGSAIRGGVPVIFPQFGNLGALPKHGFARNMMWTLRGSDRDHQCVFILADDASSRAIWPHAFLAELTITLFETALQMELAIQNPGTTAIEFTGALHTYFRVDQIDKVEVVGLDAVKSLRIDGHVDHIYAQTNDRIEIVQKHQRVVLEKVGFPDVVLWNPWEEMGAKMADLEPDGYKHMLCVEAAAVARPVTVLPGATWRASQRLEVLTN